jgi:voltage-gated potassium channel
MKNSNHTTWKELVYRVIFEADTPAGKIFDITLIGVIVTSIIAVMLESVTSLQQVYGPWFPVAEWSITVLFTLEYLVRLSCVPRPIRYAVSFFGIVDLLSILPTYLSLIFPGTQSLVVIRALRLLRIFRVLKLSPYLKGANVLMVALRTSRHKIVVFLGSIMVLVIILGSAMYLVENGRGSGFTSIPRSMYWAVVTMTTVGYGDIIPTRVLGQIIASFVMILGYAIIAIPTGIVTAEIVQAAGIRTITTRACPECFTEGHEERATFCKDCGESLIPTASD